MIKITVFAEVKNSHNTIVNITNSSNLNKEFSISIDNLVNLEEILNNITDLTGQEFSLRIDYKIEFPYYYVKNKNILEFIEEICEIFKLEYEIKNNIILIREQYNYLESYSIPFFQNPIKNNLSNDAKVISNNCKSLSVLNSNETQFWNEIEKNINLILNKNEKSYCIDKYNGIINVITNKKSHAIVKKYIDTILNKLYTQVLIECYILEIISEEGVDIPIGRAIASVRSIESNNLQNNVNFFLEFINNFAQNYHYKLDINCYSDINLLTMSQQVGKIQLLNTYSVKNVIKTESYKTHMIANEIRTEKIDISTGFSMEVLPIVINDNQIILNLSPCLSKIRDFNQDLPLLTQSELSSVFLINSGETIFIGGLEFVKEEQKSRNRNFFSMILEFFQSPKKNQKSKMIIAIKATIVKNKMINNKISKNINFLLERIDNLTKLNEMTSLEKIITVPEGGI